MFIEARSEDEGDGRSSAVGLDSSAGAVAAQSRRFAADSAVVKSPADARGASERKPSWVLLTSTVARLLDAHDSGRRTGGEHWTPPSEARRGNGDGVLPEVAWGFLEWLREQENRGGFDYVDPTPYSEAAMREWGLSVADLDYLFSLLATPTEICYARSDGPSGEIRRFLTKDSALVEKQRRGTSFRLTSVGRDALAVVGGFFRWVHAGAEARKLVVDVRNADLRSFFEQAGRLRSKIRSESIELRRAMERAEGDSLRGAFLSEAKRYTTTISEVAEVLNEVRTELMNSGTRAALRDEMNAMGEDAPNFSTINGTIGELLNAVGGLQTMFSDFLRKVQKPSGGGAARFDAAARLFLRMTEDQAPSPTMIEASMSGVGPIRPDLVGFSVHELARTIPAPREKRVAAPVLRRIGAQVSMTDRVDAFVSANASLLMRRLAEGPLSLTELFESEEFRTMGLDHLVEASSIVLNPLVLGFGARTDLRARIRQAGRKTWRLPDGWIASGRELILILDRFEDGRWIPGDGETTRKGNES
jgi:hypothetical protein